ncbi:YIP1 family protein [Epibacterium sp. MM17-32]|uniref:YIP1 family protein n=1 Tax=Epibacterium sp. MM17-32 TaxID=2917734 RepID=UPI001EF4F594|nr:YIP1 family protein [Epibacterium sp. MM17-32]MCG7626480.1 YIP1 family protein [Epibacterium sp. MM17-32]
MAVTADITATYRGPRKVIARLLSMGHREDRLLAFLMGACALMFIAQMPRLAREAHLTGQDLNMLLGGALLGIIFIAPLALYAFAWLSHMLARLLGGQGDGFRGRLALFWAFLASTPILLLNGLVAGFIGSGPALNGVGLLWLAVFLWFWLSGLREAYWGQA